MSSGRLAEVASRNSRRLVIDCDVGAHAVGGETDELGTPCRSLLEEVRASRHLVVMSPDIEAEWDLRCRGRFTGPWRSWMELKGRVHGVGNVRDTRLRDSLDGCADTDRARDEMLQDAHLLEAAFCTDNTVVSCENESRRHYRRCALDAVRGLKGLVWVRVGDHRPATLKGWLRDGAKPQDEWKLGYRPDE
jgi:hypothetical protein